MNPYLPPSSIKPLSALLCALALLSSPLAQAHGQAAHLMPINEQLQATGGSVQEDDFTKTLLVEQDGVVARIKMNSNQAVVNGKTVKLSVAVSKKDGVWVAADTLVNELFTPVADKSFKVERVSHPLDSLTADEITQAVSIIKASGHDVSNYRFSELRLKDEDKDAVWNSVLDNKPMQAKRHAVFSILDKDSIIEGEVDLAAGKVVKWDAQQGKHGMVLLDNFATVQQAIETSPEYAAALKKRGINDVKKVVTTPLTVGYFGDEDDLKHDLSVLKVVSYLDTGDGNYWAHPIENLVAVVDLNAKKVIKIEDQGVVPVPMAARPYDGSDRKGVKVKPLVISEPEGKNYSINGRQVEWGNWKFHVSLDSRVGLQLGTVTYNDKGTPRKVMYQGNLGGMVVPYGDPDAGWYFKSYLDSGEYGMGTLTSPIEKGKDAPTNAVMLDAVIPDYLGQANKIPNAIAIFERYAGPDFKHQEMGKPNVSTERRELVVRWISTVGNYDYIFDWVFSPNGTLGINAGATGIEAVKGVKSRTMHDATAKEDTRYGTLIDHNIVGTTHQHIYNFRLDMDVDGANNTMTAIDPVVTKNSRSGPRKSTMETKTQLLTTEDTASQKFDPATVRLISNYNKENRMGNPVSYQLIPFAGGTHPVAKGANFSKDEWLFKRLNFMDKQIWVTEYRADELYPEGKSPNRSDRDTGLGQFTADNGNINNKDLVVWLTTGTTHIARAEEWPIMPTEWVNVLLKPWNYFDETPTLNRH